MRLGPTKNMHDSHGSCPSARRERGGQPRRPGKLRKHQQTVSADHFPSQDTIERLQRPSPCVRASPSFQRDVERAPTQQASAGAGSPRGGAARDLRASIRPASRRRMVGTAGLADARLAGVALGDLRVGVHEAHAGIAELQHPRLHRPRRRVEDLRAASRRIQAERVAQWWSRAMDERKYRKNRNMRRGNVEAVGLWA